MDKDEFVSRYTAEKDAEKALVDKVYDEFAGFCREHNISEDDISNDKLLSVCESFVSAGLDEIDD